MTRMADPRSTVNVPEVFLNDLTVMLPVLPAVSIIERKVTGTLVDATFATGLALIVPKTLA